MPRSPGESKWSELRCELDKTLLKLVFIQSLSDINTALITARMRGFRYSFREPWPRKLRPPVRPGPRFETSCAHSGMNNLIHIRLLRPRANKKLQSPWPRRAKSCQRLGLLSSSDIYRLAPPVSFILIYNLKSLDAE